MSKPVPEVKPDETITPQPQAPAAVKPESRIEEWWSRISPKHMIVIKQRDSEGVVQKDAKGNALTTYAKFDRSRLELDLDRPDHKNISKGLRESGQEGVGIYLIGNNYSGTGMGDKERVFFMKTLRELAADETGLGLDKIMGLFSLRELREMGVNLNRPKDYVDTLIFNALKTKALAQVK